MLTFSRCKPDEDRIKRLSSTYRAPANVPNLTLPRTNTEVWDNLNHGYQTVDVGAQKVQSLQAGALTAIIRVIEEICKGTAGPTESHLVELMDAVRLMCMAFASLSQVRKESIRNALGYPLAHFCNWDNIVGKDTLFVDLSKKLKDRDEAQLKLRRRNRFR